MVRRTFTDFNLTRINTHDDRYMKVADHGRPYEEDEGPDAERAAVPAVQTSTAPAFGFRTTNAPLGMAAFRTVAMLGAAGWNGTPDIAARPSQPWSARIGRQPAQSDATGLDLLQPGS
jgi:hypothetical protein